MNNWKSEKNDERIKVFLDTEFTGLHKNTTLISLGITSEFGDSFYAEFTDYDRESIENDKWIQYNVINNLVFGATLNTIGTQEVSIVDVFSDFSHSIKRNRRKTEVKGTKEEIVPFLIEWLQSIREDDCRQIEFWSDCLAWDWVLFVDLFGTSFDLPDYIYPYPMDICTLFRYKGIDPDISREEFSGYDKKDNKHNALFDSEVIKACFEKLVNEI